MPSITLYQGKPTDLAAVRDLLSSAGLALEGEMPPAGALECRNPHPVILVVLHKDLEHDAGFAPAAMAAAGQGRRIIGIWPKGSTAGEAPTPFKKYSSDQVVWDANRVRKAICDLAAPAYDTPIGTPQPAPKTERNC